MQSNTDRTITLWMTSADLPQPAVLAQDIEADVCIVGGGIAGLTTAYLLAREQLSVVVLDAGVIGGGQTTRTSAHLVNAIDDKYYEIARIFGKEGARLAAESHTAAIDRIEQIVQTENIPCDFARVDGFLIVPPGDPLDKLDRELEAAHEAGLSGVEMLERAPYQSFNTGPCLRFPRQGEFHITKYLRGLTRAIAHNGGQLFSRTRATKLEGGAACRVETEHDATVHCRFIVVATNSPINGHAAIHTKQAPYRTFVVAAPVPRGYVPHILCWDTLDPYHYIRVVDAAEGGLADEHELLLVGGEDHKTGQADDTAERYAKLEAWARSRFPDVKDVIYRWSGQIMETVDGLGYSAAILEMSRTSILLPATPAWVSRTERLPGCS